ARSARVHAAPARDRPARRPAAGPAPVRPGAPGRAAQSPPSRAPPPGPPAVPARWPATARHRPRRDRA
ncbi:MAG TPA: hypothetical protein EYH47_08180, partial [Pseudomonas oleovorans]|nr:hypothetical protein [Pseudomonas oleovorans]